MKYFLTAQPQARNRVTQEFGDRPEYYGKFWFLGHEGVDLNDTPWVGSNIYAAEGGTIVYTEMDGAYGNRIDIYNLDMKLKISYCHVFRSSVKTGDRVKPGQIIGISWNTSTYEMPIHLHFMVTEIDENLQTINTRNGYNWSVYTGVEDGKVYIESTRNIVYKYKGIRVIRKPQPKSRPKRLGMYQPYKDIIYLYDRAYTLEEKEFLLLLEHEWLHRVYWKEFTKEQREAWEKISRLDPEVQEELKKKRKRWYNPIYWMVRYISPKETNESEDFAETGEDICKNPYKVYNDYRDTKREAFKGLMSLHGYSFNF